MDGATGAASFGEVWDAPEDEEGESMLESELSEENASMNLLDDGQATECHALQRSAWLNA